MFAYWEPFVLVIAIVLVHKMVIVLALFAGAVVLALASAVTVRTLALRVWLIVLAFTGVIALPALFLTPGVPITASSPITRQGLYAAAMLVAASGDSGHPDHDPGALHSVGAGSSKHCARSMFLEKW